MTREEFKALPYLLTPGQAASVGYNLATLDKYADCGLLAVVLPKGCQQRRFRKIQFAQMLGWEDTIDLVGWWREKPLVGLAVVTQWTGYHRNTVSMIVREGGLVAVQPGGIGEAKYRKADLGAWLGFNESGCESGKAVVKSGQTIAAPA